MRLGARVSSIVLSLLASGCAAPGSEVTPLDYRWGEQPASQVGSLRGVPPGRRGEDRLEVYLTVPPLPACDDPALLLESASELEAARIDDRSVDVHRRPYGVIPVRAADAGKRMTLTFRVESGINQGELRAGCERDLVAWWIVKDILQFGVATFLLLGSLVLAVASLSRRAPRSHKYLTLFAASLGTVELVQSPGLLHLLTVHPRPFWSIRDVATFLYLIAMSRFVVHAFGDTRRRIFHRLSLVLAGMVVTAIVLDGLGVVSLHRAPLVTFAMVPGVAVIAIVHLYHRARTGNVAARLFIGGLVTLLLFAMPDIMWGFGHPLFEVNVGPIGAMAFAVSMAAVAQRGFQDQTSALERRVREVEQLNAELRHQIERRSNELRRAVSEAPPSAMMTPTLVAGDTVDRYRIVDRLGSGSMGAVYEVARAADGARFAVKVMTGVVTREHAARFAREAEVAAKVHHENVVGIVDVGLLDSGMMFLVMELVPGGSLADANTRFGDVPWALRVVAQIARGLAALHATGIIHRDLKPSNVLLARDDDTGQERAMLADFGIAHVDEVALAQTQPLLTSARASTLSEPVAPSSLTATGALLGTPLYMAPELATRAAATRASDVYALGVIAFELLAGAYPFVEPPIVRALRGVPPATPIDLRAETLDAATHALVRAMLASAPRDRPTAAAVAEALASRG